ncbi:putative barnase/colicin E5 family endoribonuclease, partial [Helicobacter vulpis]
LSKIVEKHLDDFSGFEGGTPLEKLGNGIEEIVKNGKIVKRQGRTEAYNIEHNGFIVGVNKSYDKKGDNYWIVTAFDKATPLGEKTPKTARAKDLTKGADNLPLNSDKKDTTSPLKAQETTELKETLTQIKSLIAAQDSPKLDWELFRTSFGLKGKWPDYTPLIPHYKPEIREHFKRFAYADAQLDHMNIHYTNPKNFTESVRYRSYTAQDLEYLPYLKSALEEPDYVALVRDTFHFLKEIEPGVFMHAQKSGHFYNWDYQILTPQFFQDYGLREFEHPFYKAPHARPLPYKETPKETPKIPIEDPKASPDFKIPMLRSSTLPHEWQDMRRAEAMANQEALDAHKRAFYTHLKDVYNLESHQAYYTPNLPPQLQEVLGGEKFLLSQKTLYDLYKQSTFNGVKEALESPYIVLKTQQGYLFAKEIDHHKAFVTLIKDEKGLWRARLGTPKTFKGVDNQIKAGAQVLLDGRGRVDLLDPKKLSKVEQESGEVKPSAVIQSPEEKEAFIKSLDLSAHATPIPKEIDIEGFLKSLKGVKNKERFIEHLASRTDGQRRLEYLHLVEPTLKSPDIKLVFSEDGKSKYIKAFRREDKDLVYFLVTQEGDQYLITGIPDVSKRFIRKEIQHADIIHSFIPPYSKNANALSGLQDNSTKPPLKKRAKPKEKKPEMTPEEEEQINKRLEE